MRFQAGDIKRRERRKIVASNESWKECTKSVTSEKRSEHLRAGIHMKYPCIEHQKHEFPVLVMCRVLEVSERGLYAWRKRPICQRTREDAQRTKEIQQVFASHQSRLGSPRLHVE
jgi:hypothetical protein